MGDFKRSYFKLLVLRLLQEEEMYGYRLAQVVKQKSKARFQIKEGTLYPILHDLEKKGLIEGKWRKSPQGPERKYFYLTPSGKEHLESEKKILQEFVRLVLV